MPLGVTALIVAALIATPAVNAGRETVSPTRAHHIVVRETAQNQSNARQGARRHLRSVDLPPGARLSADRPTGIGKLLQGPLGIPGGPPRVALHRFWTVPAAPEQVLAWVRHHLPSGTRVGARLTSGDVTSLEIEKPVGSPGDRGGLLYVDVVQRSGGGSAVRADVFETWERPRSPLAQIPGGSRFLGLTVSPGAGGLHAEGEPTRHSRFVATEDRGLIARLVRIVNRQPRFQAIFLPSCGPQGQGSEYHLFTFVFRTSRRGRIVGRVTQEIPIGICSALKVRVGARKPYALEGGQNVLRAAHALIRSAHPTAAASRPGPLKLLDHLAKT